MSTTVETKKQTPRPGRRWLVGVALVVILAAALLLRLYNNNWDANMHAHPDERWIVMVAGEMHLPDGLAQALDPRLSPANPLWNLSQGQVRHFAYGHLPLYLLTISAAALHAVGQTLLGAGASGEWVDWLVRANSFDGLNLVGRVLSALFDVGTVLLTFLIGRRVYDWRAGLLGAAFVALTVTHIQLSHFYAFDPVAAFFIVLAVYGGIRMAQDGTWGDAVLAGLAAGAAVSSKFSALPILAVLVVGAAARYWAIWRADQSGDRRPRRGATTPGQIVGLVVVAGLMALLAFAITSPFALLDWDAFRQSVITEQGAMVRGEADFPYTRQYRGTIPYLYNIEQQVRWGMGWPLGLLAFIGFGWVLVRAVLGRAKGEEWVMLAWCVPYFLLTGLFMVKFMRYMLPLLPFFSLMGAALLVRLWRGPDWLKSTGAMRAESAPPGAETVTAAGLLAESAPPGADGDIGVGTRAAPGGAALLEAAVKAEVNAESAPPGAETVTAAGLLAESAPPGADGDIGVGTRAAPGGAALLEAAVKAEVNAESAPPGAETVTAAGLLAESAPPGADGDIGVGTRAAPGGAALLEAAVKAEVIAESAPPGAETVTAGALVVESAPPGAETVTVEALAAESAPPGADVALAVPPSSVDERRTRRPAWAWLAPILALVVLASTAFWAVAFVNGVYGHEHTWVTASKWIYDNVPDGSVLAGEHWDDTLPKDLQTPPGAFRGAHNYRVTDIPNYEEDTPAKFETLKQMLGEADYVALATNRLYKSIPRLPERYPMTTKYYELLFSDQLGFEKVAEFASRPRLGPWEFVDDDADESFTVYDHPKPIIFKKVRDLSDAEWDQLLGGTWEDARPGYVGEPNLLERLLDSLPLFGDGAASSPPVQPAERDKTLLLDRPTQELPAPYDLGWNSLASNSPVLAVIVWWLALLLLQVIAWPLTFTLFSRLRDRGWPFARLVGWLVSGWLVWITASLHLPVVGNNLLTIGLALVAVALLSFWLWRRQRAALREFWRTQRGLVLLVEAIFAGAFLVFVLIRMLNPDLWQPWQGGEKFMEFAFLNATTRSTWMPPLDPYYAGGIINYYYYGYFLVSLLIKLTGITASVAFNLAVPTLFAATVTGAFSLVYNLVPVRRVETDDETPNRVPRWAPGIGAGLIGGLFVAVVGNLDAMGQVVRRLGEQGTTQFQSQIPGLQSLVRAVSGVQTMVTTGSTLPSFDWWAPSRVLPFTINEFPYWSFLFADLHPHMMGMPFTILFLAAAFNLLAGADRPTEEGRLVRVIRFLFIPLTLGALATINTWDLPTYLGIVVLAFIVGDYRRSGRLRLLPIGLFAVAVAALSYLLYLPFFQNYAAVGSSGVGLVQGKTQLSQWLLIWGFFLFLVFSYLLVELRSHNRQGQPDRRAPAVVRWLRLLVERWDAAPRLVSLQGALVTQPAPVFRAGRIVLLIVLLLAVVLAILGYWVPALLLLPVTVVGLLLFRRDAPAGRTFALLLVFAGLLVLLGVEFVFLKDFLCGCAPGSGQVGDYYRMNTLFKFYIQVWVLLALGAAAGLPLVWQTVQERFNRPWRLAWNVAFVVLTVAVLAFPVLGTPRRVADRFPGERPAFGTLDGMAFMTVGSYTWPDASNTIELKYDYDAIQWLLDNVRGNPVVAEGRIDYYREGGMRVASFTGLPGLLGAHQGEQRYSDQVGTRENQARELFSTADIARTQQLLDELDVGYIYLGRLERTVYPSEGIAKFEQMAQQGLLQEVYRNPEVVIYARMGDGG